MQSFIQVICRGYFLMKNTIIMGNVHFVDQV